MDGLLMSYPEYVAFMGQAYSRMAGISHITNPFAAQQAMDALIVDLYKQGLDRGLRQADADKILSSVPPEPPIP